MMSLKFKPVWFDSLGAKSACCLVETPDASILLDPGIAAMQPSFPASRLQKLRWKMKGKKEIKRAASRADIIIISHYHHDHYMPNDLGIYKHKLILAKDPNAYINDSQRKRAELFYSKLCKRFGKISLAEILLKPEKLSYANPLNELKIANKKDFGDYNRRREELIKAGLNWFKARTKKWQSYARIPELDFENLRVRFADRKQFCFGETKIRFTKPLFHGIEFARVGWVIATVIEYEGKKFIHTSDLNGPIIEDYAEWLCKEKPDLLVLDGPATYMLGYMLNRINLNRAIENACKIIKETNAKLIIYDHHLPREKRFKERTSKLWQLVKKLNKNVSTAAEYLGKKPIVLEL